MKGLYKNMLLKNKWLQYTLILIGVVVLIGLVQKIIPKRKFFGSKGIISVFVEQVSQEKLTRNLIFPAMVEAYNSFPQTAFFNGIVHEIPVEVGDLVQENTPIYKMQQIKPGQEFLSSWMGALNSGTIISVNVLEGEEVLENATILTIGDLDRFKAKLAVSPKDIDKIKIGMSVLFIKDDGESIDMGAKVSLIPLIPNLQGNLFQVEVTIPKNPQIFLGKVTRFLLQVQPFEGISVPQELIVQRSGRPTLTIVKEGKIVYQPVELGVLYEQKQSIIGGLEPDDLYVVSTSRRYREGDSVTIQNKEALTEKNHV
ncbi:MAG: efflux RND transporter periplasmic adaptor subunit [Spirochaetia bacterium]